MSIENLIDIEQEEATPNIIVNDDGTLEIDLSNEEDSEIDLSLQPLYNKEEHYGNLVDLLDEETAQELADEVIDNTELDDLTRETWLNTLEMGLDLLGVEIQEKNTPFKGACSAQHPLLLEAAVKFQSKASSELLPADGPVHGLVLGEVTVEKEEKANRVKKHMNWQITEQMTEFEIDTEKVLLHTPTVGSCFKKTYYSSRLKRPVSEIVTADQLIVNNSYSDLYRAPRFTHVIFKNKYDLRRDFVTGFYSEPENLGEPAEFKRSDFQKKVNNIQGMEIDLGGSDDGYTLYEQYVETYIEGIDDDINPEKLALPYIITVDVASSSVIGIRRNWRPDDSDRKKKVPFTHYSFVPGFGFYSFGYIHLLGNIQLSLTSSLRSLIDAGQFANLQGGFKLKGVKIVDDSEPISPGEFKEIEASVQDINKALMPLPFKEPSQALFAMLQWLDGKGQKFADSTEQVIADATNYGPVGTTMALLDASTKFFSSIHRRLHKSQKHELRLIAEVNSETLPDEYFYNTANDNAKITRDDYDLNTVDVVPVSDPNISSNAHRMTKAQALFEMALKSPQEHDMRQVLKHVYTAMDYADVDKILPKPEEAQPADPITEIQMALQGKPIRAFPEQDNETHIKVKTAFISDPTSGGSMPMQKVAMVLQANIAEHMILKFAKEMQAMGGDTDMAKAAQEVANLNIKKVEQEMSGQSDSEMLKAEASMVLAQSEVYSAKNDADKIAFEREFKKAELALRKEQNDTEKAKILMKLQELGIKHSNEIDKLFKEKGLDALIAELQKQGESEEEIAEKVDETNPVSKKE